MDLTGKIHGMTIDITSGKLNLTLQVDQKGEAVLDELKELAPCEKLSVVVKKWRKKRSLDANAYYWVLISKIAEKLRSSKEEVHNLMLARYGQPEREDDGSSVVISVLERIDLSKRDDIHVKAIGHGTVEGKRFTHYLLLRGSHTYDTKEMSVLIDGVVSEAREMGIETMSTEELERLLAAWKGGRKEPK
ncbi:MAG: hypothetical protein IJV14_03170 [Lachnospiraceae bacterium]|nr:hypothetical protein [Lachnospiraceae bacterium]